MPDREKVIDNLQAIKTFFASKAIDEKDEITREAFVDSQSIIDNALALMKEQEAIIEQYRRADGFLAVHGWKWEGRWE